MNACNIYKVSLLFKDNFLAKFSIFYQFSTEYEKISK